ncbi:hypothetical protein GKC56_04895 [Neisseriaceae bacterium PsAf]|nr:hypothetical protein [Neisseriaceae bacterium PsAf]MCV2502786.1 AzlD domain-containing protein [Neisseriaceae bacterium]
MSVNMDKTCVFWAIFGEGIVTLIPRVMPFVWSEKIQKFKLLFCWLEFIPVTMMLSLILFELSTKYQQDSTDFGYVPALSLMAVLTAVLTNSLFATVIIPVIFSIILNYYFGVI